jgi:hypothetical protein
LAFELVAGLYDHPGSFVDSEVEGDALMRDQGSALRSPAYEPDALKCCTARIHPKSPMLA